MFDRASSKLEDAISNLDSMKTARDAVQFKSGFNSFLSNCRAITFALQKEGARIQGFDAWYRPKQEQMKRDELLRFVHESRTEDFHEGGHRLLFSTHIHSMSTDSIGSPPHPSATLVIGAEGPFWIVHKGTPNERRIPVIQGSSHTISVSVKNPPKMHKGMLLVTLDPISLCEVAAQYMAELIHEARASFRSVA